MQIPALFARASILIRSQRDSVLRTFLLWKSPVGSVHHDLINKRLRSAVASQRYQYKHTKSDGGRVLDKINVTCTPSSLWLGTLAL